jgi:two-component system, OmpR family, sensor histidine kinase KdpD
MDLQMNNINDIRQNPDFLFGTPKQGGESTGAGKLKIFFGMCAGVGKTYTMLEAAQKANRDGIDVVVGIAETHNRAETEELLAGLEIVPKKEVEYRMSLFNEMDIDAILKRKPSLVLIDELAHTNIPGSRHVKRYQDVLELLNKGINVYTTLNVQHIESRAETVKQITGAIVHETVPDSVLERANEIELVDLTPVELIQRLKEGKVYTYEKSKQAVENFFRKGNLTALREMALRITAERVDKDLQNYRAEKNINATWKSGQRLMVAISPSPSSAQLIRWTRRLAYSMETQWIAVYIETTKRLGEKKKESLNKNIALAKDLGAEIITSQDTNIASGLIRVARENNSTQILLGKSKSPFNNFFSRNSKIISRLIKASGDIDIYVIGDEQKESQSFWESFNFSMQSSPLRYLLAILLITVLSAFLYSIHFQVGYQTVSLIFLFVITFMPLWNFGPGPIFLAALMSATIWNYFFIPPSFTLRIGKVEDALMFVMYFIIASVSGFLISRIRTQQTLINQREKRTSALYNLAKALSSAKSLDDVTDCAIKQLEETFTARVVFIYSDNHNKLKAEPHSASTFPVDGGEWNIAHWVFGNSQKAGRFTSTLPITPATYFPISTKSENFGVIGVALPETSSLSFDSESLLDTFLSQITIAIEREFLKENAKNSLVVLESEKLYKTLFDSISHELKTPITTIIGATSSFKDDKIIQNKNILSKLVDEINIASERLSRLVDNLLDMARLQTGNLRPKLEWHSVSDLIDSAINRVKPESVNHKIIAEIADEVGIIHVDYGLIEQALVNILHNSIQYTPENSEIKIKVARSNSFYSIRIIDRGPGFTKESLSRIFEKFYRIPGTKAGGTGLGLSIAKGFVEAHNGTITAQNNEYGGAEFIILLPTN